MSEEEAKFRARDYWGEHGAVGLIRGPHSLKYVVGTSTLPSRLGGHVSTVYGSSWSSFEEAFQNAVMSGHLPHTDFEGDDSLEYEA